MLQLPVVKLVFFAGFVEFSVLDYTFRKLSVNWLSDKNEHNKFNGNFHRYDDTSVSVAPGGPTIIPAIMFYLLFFPCVSCT